jgi:phosphohistidine phosphatase
LHFRPELLAHKRVQRTCATWRRVRTPATCSAPDPANGPPRSPPGSDADARTERQPETRRTGVGRAATRISGTVIGRAVVELCALAVGAFLLLVVVIWRALRWLANVRRLGKWAWTRSRVVLDALRGAQPILAGFEEQADAKGKPRDREGTPNQGTVQLRSDQNRPPMEDVPSQPLTGFETEVVSKSDLADMQNELQRMRTLIETSAAERQEVKHAISLNASSPLAVHAADMSTSPAGTHDPAQGVLSTPPLRLVIMRHAKSAWDRSGEMQDFERQLSPQGRAEAALIGAELERRGWLPSHVLCSSSARTVETLRLLRASAASSALSPSFGVPEPTITETLYFAVSAEEMAAAIDSAASPHSLHGAADSLLCIAHNPGCEALIEFLTGEKHTMGTACVALLECQRGDDSPRLLDEFQSRNTGWKLKSQAGRFRLEGILRPQELLERG